MYIKMICLAINDAPTKYSGLLGLIGT